ncbi:hypothetical protein [Noviherbaspirillum sp.]|uniref:hypothetical protein n=1 Tax=Noviherbaspirillum sp. TaxID=1926288 RepID=UPI002B498E0D|nr:hypothetical protein [Noviherbaspirillum sp.]HJV79271.1 hypothetical protein [Noviherbaspirillum sp.]
MASEPRHFMDEQDIGSGEKSPAQTELEREQRSINPDAESHPNGGKKGHEPNGTSVEGHPGDPQAAATDTPATGRVLQSGEHLARILALPLPDGNYEAQVYVRLTREPEIAETYIPAGTFPTEAQAWTAAEERAKRAFNEHEF